jgi:putative FmdB family regulatory protein
MPIYAYKCSSCGHADDVLQKISAEPLTDCPACGKPTYSKQVTAPQFQLKGSGWYVTDFRGGNGAKDSKDGKPAAKAGEGNANAGSEGKSDTKSETASTGTTPAATTTPAPAAPVAKPAAASE